jgi:NAD(P)-dependent dehydrogenase (short-subunit alcohol dehydrogenase family)
MRTLFPGVALVTGAAGGIGGRIAASFAQEGCTRIAITDREVAGLVDTEKLILAAHTLYVNSDKSHEPVEIKSIPVDIKDEKGIEELIKTVAATFGRVDYAVNCAGNLSSYRNFCFF